jgi:hypothetical protein
MNPMGGPITQVFRAGESEASASPELAEVGPRLRPRAIAQGEVSSSSENAATVAFFSRFFILQSIGLAGFAFLWIAGLADNPFESRSALMCGIILLVGALGLLCVSLQRWRDVQWIATHVVRIGLLGTVIGLIIAFSHATSGAGDPQDIKPMISSVVSGMYVSLYATLFGIGTNLWLKINLRLLGNQHG